LKDYAFLFPNPFSTPLYYTSIPYLYEPVDNLLNSLREELDNKIYTVNKRIQDGQNPHIKITGKGDNL